MISLINWCSFSHAPGDVINFEMQKLLFIIQTDFSTASFPSICHHNQNMSNGWDIGNVSGELMKSESQIFSIR